MSVLLTPVVLAASGSDPQNVSAGWIGFVVFIALAVAVTLLWLSFRKQLKKIDFEEEPDDPIGPAGADEGAEPNGPES